MAFGKQQEAAAACTVGRDIAAVAAWWQPGMDPIQRLSGS
jgi:hypothetical protein